MAKGKLLSLLTVLVMFLHISIAIDAMAYEHPVNDSDSVEHCGLKCMQKLEQAEEELVWAKNLRSKSQCITKSAIMQKLKELDAYNRDGASDTHELGGRGSRVKDQTMLGELASNRAQLKIFVSSSMPRNLLKAYSAQAVKYGGTLVFKGLPGGSFKELMKYVTEISAAPDTGSIQIDDEAFDRFSILSVPAILLIKEEGFEEGCIGESCRVIYDKISGSIGIQQALQKFSANGDLAEEATRLLER